MSHSPTTPSESSLLRVITPLRSRSCALHLNVNADLPPLSVASNNLRNVSHAVKRMEFRRNLLIHPFEVFSFLSLEQHRAGLIRQHLQLLSRSHVRIVTA